MDFGVTGKLGGYYLAEQYRKNAAAERRAERKERMYKLMEGTFTVSATSSPTGGSFDIKA